MISPSKILGPLSSIQNQLLLRLFPSAIVALFIIVFWNYLQIKNSALQELDNNVANAAHLIANDTENALQQRINDLLTLSQSPLFADYYNNQQYRLFQEAATYRHDIEKFLTDFLRRSNVYTEAIFLDPSGESICHLTTPPTSQRNFSLIRDAVLKRSLESPQQQFLISEKSQTLTDIGEILYLSKTLQDSSQRIIGVLALGYNLKTLEETLHRAPLGHGGVASIEDANGRILVGRPSAIKNPLEKTSSLKQQPWKIRVVVDSERALEPLRQIRNRSIFLGFLMVIALMLVMVLIVRNGVYPINLLVKATRELAQGNLDHRVSIHRPMEIKSLAQAFNEMALNLKNRELYQQQLQEQLIRSEKLSTAGQLISGIAHELNNPLHGVTGYAELIQDSDCSEELKHDLGQIQAHAKRCRQIVDNLLQFVRHDPIEKKHVDINDTIESILLLLDYQLKKAENVTVIFNRSLLPPILGNPGQIEQVLINLIQNSCDALKEVPSKQQRSLDITTAHKGEHVIISIADNGPGIKDDVRHKIFEPFFTTKPAGHGTGMGLAITSQIIRDHGGTITFDNRPTGGALFTIHLPVAQSLPAHSTSAPDTSQQSSPSYFVLVVDDEKHLTKMVSRMLKKLGHTSEIVYSVDQAVEQLIRDDYGLILLDLAMPQKNGRDLYDWIAEHKPALSNRIIIMTGDVLSRSVFEFFDQQGTPYLIKPFTTKELAQSIAKIPDISSPDD